jgi:hypothetical protein
LVRRIGTFVDREGRDERWAETAELQMIHQQLVTDDLEAVDDG